MIKFFQKAQVLFPWKWANAVSRWILGVHSPNGTITVKNTATPDEDGSLQLDVNIHRVARLVEEEYGGALSANMRRQIIDVARALLDGVTLAWKDGVAAVNEDWLLEYLRGVMADFVQSSSEAGVRAPAGTTAISSGAALQITGATDTFTFGAPGGTGAVVHLLCRAADDGAVSSFYFRPFTISSDGRIYAIGGENCVQDALYQ